MPGEPTSSGHPTPEELARFLDRKLEPQDRTRVAEHLAECATCRSDLIRAGRVVHGAGAPQRLVGRAAVTIVVLAAVLGILTGRRREDARLRGARPTRPLIAYAPIGRTDSLLPRFTWGAASPGSHYRLSLFDPGGAPVWTTSVRDTTAVLPADRTLTRGTAYTWIVDALQTDGSERSTGVRQFQIGQ